MKKYLNIYLVWAGVFIILPLVLILFYSFNGSGSIAFENFSFSLSNYKRFFEPLYLKMLGITLLGRNGVLNRFLASFGSGPLGIMYTPTAVVLGMIYEFLPFMVIQIYNALKKVDKNLIDAALDLGADKKTIFRKVIFPLSLPGVYTGIIMVFIPAISTFVVSNLLGGQKVYMIGNLIDQQFTFTGDWGFGSATAIILMMILFLALFIQRRFGRDLEGDIV